MECSPDNVNKLSGDHSLRLMLALSPLVAKNAEYFPERGAPNGIGYCGTEPFQGESEPSTAWRGLGCVTAPWASAVAAKDPSSRAARSIPAVYAKVFYAKTMTAA